MLRSLRESPPASSIAAKAAPRRFLRARPPQRVTKMSSPSRPASQALIISVTSGRLIKRLSSCSRNFVFSFGIRSKWSGNTGDFLIFHFRVSLPRLRAEPSRPNDQSPRRSHIDRSRRKSFSCLNLPNDAGEVARDTGFFGNDKGFGTFKARNRSLASL